MRPRRGTMARPAAQFLARRTIAGGTFGARLVKCRAFDARAGGTATWPRRSVRGFRGDGRGPRPGRPASRACGSRSSARCGCRAERRPYSAAWPLVFRLPWSLPLGFLLFRFVRSGGGGAPKILNSTSLPDPCRAHVRRWCGGGSRRGRRAPALPRRRCGCAADAPRCARRQATDRGGRLQARRSARAIAPKR